MIHTFCKHVVFISDFAHVTLFKRPKFRTEVVPYTLELLQ